MTFHSNFLHAQTIRGALVLLLVCVLATSARAVKADGSDAAVTESSAPASIQAPAQQPTAPRPSPPQQNPGEMTAAANTTQQSSQGQQYGQPGFVGEPIDLNVVNADIRDILNYITEQYGVNFVIDMSVTAVPVTVNVTGVPWNIALDAILKANRLGIDVTGNILRVATTEVIAGEATVRATINNARLDNSPLVTEFIRLNYARASGSLEQTAGAGGGYAGGIASGAVVAGNVSEVGAIRAVSGKSAEEGILPIIQRRLSRRGGIEVDSRSNTLIVTDVRENIDSIRQLVSLLDQPEPQVEIETRIVIASRNFSRDLGVQLGAVAINASRGGLASGSTLPGGGTITSGPNEFGIPGGLAGTTQPSGALGASGPNTVIGLTTGIFGTAQISALITAGEAKGQAKTIASPRVSTLNNRTAEIEAGTQIPVVTPQGAGGGAAVFTTTFVSVPLRLSVTPQITDAGTVVLRVSAENNNIRADLTNSLGTPGISTQRMQTEVLVPDGGTTVIGGSLIDVEGETQNRTPGLASVPLLGNLFKRRATTRNTDEILFFITPRIYRSDYHGRPMAGTVGNTTRIVSIPQPVPLGNPGTNTPTPTAQPNTQPQQVLPSTTGSPLTSQPAARP